MGEKITYDKLAQLGFVTDNDENSVIRKYYKTSDDSSEYEWRIMLEQSYDANNQLKWSVICWKCDEMRRIVLRSLVSHIEEVSKLYMCADLCDIEI